MGEIVNVPSFPDWSSISSYNMISMMTYKKTSFYNAMSLISLKWMSADCVLAEALAIFRGHVLKHVLQVLADCESQSVGENPWKQQRVAASAGYVWTETKFMLTLLSDKSFSNPQPSIWLNYRRSQRRKNEKHCWQQCQCEKGFFMTAASSAFHIVGFRTICTEDMNAQCK